MVTLGSYPRQGLSRAEVSQQLGYARGTPLPTEGENHTAFGLIRRSTDQLVKLYFTSNGPVPELAGQEEEFPSPDNQSKMKRSCENAEHVGKLLSSTSESLTVLTWFRIVHTQCRAAFSRRAAEKKITVRPWNAAGSFGGV